MARRKNDSKRQERFLFSTFIFSSSTRLQLTAVPLIRSVNAVIDAVTYPVNNDDDMVIFALCNGLGMGIGKPLFEKWSVDTGFAQILSL